MIDPLFVLVATVAALPGVVVGAYGSTAFVWNQPELRQMLPSEARAALRSVGFTE